MANCGADKMEAAQFMDQKINWNPDYDFAMLSMMQPFTDEELENLGMSPQDIIKYRAYEKRNEEKMTEQPVILTGSDHTHASGGQWVINAARQSRKTYTIYSDGNAFESSVRKA